MSTITFGISFTKNETHFLSTMTLTDTGYGTFAKEEKSTSIIRYRRGRNAHFWFVESFSRCLIIKTPFKT